MAELAHRSCGHDLLDHRAAAQGIGLLTQVANDRILDQPDLARIGTLIADDHVQQGGLAGTVRPDDGDAVAREYL